MPDPTVDSNPPSFLLFQKGSFLDFEGLLESRWPDKSVLVRKIIFAILVTWAPMVILAAIQGLAIGPTRSQSILLDPAMYARFLVALPILFYARKASTIKLRAIVDHFLLAELVKDSERDRFVANIISAMRLCYLPAVDWLALALAYSYSIVHANLIVPNVSDTWHTIGPAGQVHLSLAGWWFAAVSQPVYLFVLFRLLYRVGIWWRFLRQTARLDLQLDAAHPDQAGGLGFLGLTFLIFQESAFAISVSLAGGLADLVLTTGARVSSFVYVIVAAVIFIVALFAGPLLFFCGLLAKVKQNGELKYRVLWQEQLRQFDQKWSQLTTNPPDMLSVADFSEATDFSSILERVQQTRLVPIQRKQILPLAIAALLPFVLVLPLLVPIDQILKQLLKMVF